MSRILHRVLASALLAASVQTPASAQDRGPPSAPAANRAPAPVLPGRETGGGLIGGTISGRMNLIGPGPADPRQRELQPVDRVAPPSMFLPERLDKVDPAIVDGVRLPKLDPTGPLAPVHPAAPATAPASREAALPPPAAPIVKEPLFLSATFDENGAKIPGGVKWRVFTDQPDANGEHLLVAESSEAEPRFDLDPGNYIVHAVYGLVSAAKFVTVRAGQPATQRMILKAGGVRLSAYVGDAKPPDGDVSFTLSRDEGGLAQKVADHVRPGTLLRLPAGAYHVVSNYGDANAIVEVDLQVPSGKLVNAQVHHRAAPVTLKLVDRPGGRELGNTSWTILTPGGDVIRDSIGALPRILLAEGDYTAIARHDGRMYQQSFAVKAGVAAAVQLTTEGG